MEAEKKDVFEQESEALNVEETVEAEDTEAVEDTAKNCDEDAKLSRTDKK